MHNNTIFFKKIHKDLSTLPSSLKQISIAFFIYSLSWGIIVPFMPLYLKNHVSNYTELGLIIGLLPLVTLLIKIPIGDLVDKMNKKTILSFALLNYFLIGPLYAITTELQVLIITRSYHAISSVGIWIPANAFVREHSPKKLGAESMGLFSASNSLAMTIGPLIGAIFLTGILVFYPTIKNPINYLFYFPAIAALITFFIIKKIPEKTNHNNCFSNAIKEVVITDKLYKKELIDYIHEGRKGVYVTLLRFVLSFSLATLTMNLALVASQNNASFIQIGLIYSLFYIPFTLQFIFGDIADHIGKNKILYYGTTTTAFFFLMLFFSHNLFYLFTFTLFVALGISMMGPVIEEYITSVGDGKDGEVTGIYGSITSLGYIAGPITAGILLDTFGGNLGINAPFALCAIMLIMLLPIIKKL